MQETGVGEAEEAQEQEEEDEGAVEENSPGKGVVEKLPRTNSKCQQQPSAKGCQKDPSYFKTPVPSLSSIRSNFV